ncbi:MAG TPA: DUF2157 domain-containing protein [Bacillota bacterium]|nr:DUF2157 domain-containing protein [Bacillota bacterium]
MEKRQLGKRSFEILLKELDFWEDSSVLSPEQVSTIKAGYEVKATFNFVRVILFLGALLVGLGILSFIASNWEVMSKLTKFLLILGFFIGFNVAGNLVSSTYPKVGRSLIYIGVFVYGAGIFLIGQAFNFGGHFSSAFLLWGAGILPMGILLRDKVIVLFAHVLLLVNINGCFDLQQYPWITLAVLPFLYYFNRLFGYDRLITFASNVVAINLLGFTLNYLHVSSEWIFLTLFVLGLVFCFSPMPFNSLVFKLQGILLVGIFGLTLTIPESWEFIQYDNINLYFTIPYLLLLLFFIQRGNLLALLFFCLTIFRFYTDTFYDFMPKSLFFVLGGVMLLAFGFYFERKRHRQGGLGLEK